MHWCKDNCALGHESIDIFVTMHLLLTLHLRSEFHLATVDEVQLMVETVRCQNPDVVYTVNEDDFKKANTREYNRCCDWSFR